MCRLFIITVRSVRRRNIRWSGHNDYGLCITGERNTLFRILVVETTGVTWLITLVVWMGGGSTTGIRNFNLRRRQVRKNFKKYVLEGYLPPPPLHTPSYPNMGDVLEK